MFRFAALGSGSKGNALVVESGRTRVLLDCGFGPREMTRRLAQKQLVPADLDAIVITHEHSDHMGGAAACARAFKLPLYLTYGSFLAGLKVSTDVVCHFIDSHTNFAIGDLLLQPFPVPHDAREPVQFVFSDGDVRLGVLTDVGSITPHIVSVLNDIDAFVLETNHDEEMLAKGKYPASLKRRVSGDWGHLSNRAAAELLHKISQSRLGHLRLAHLSEANNHPALALASLATCHALPPENVAVSTQNEGFPWCVLQ